MRRTRIAPGIYQDASGFSVIAKVGSGPQHARRKLHRQRRAVHDAARGIARRCPPMSGKSGGPAARRLPDVRLYLTTASHVPLPPGARATTTRAR